MLTCPKCKQLLHKLGNSYQCESHHTYDIAKRGYVNLLLGNHKMSGDDKEMIRARTRFLSHGYYQPLCDELCVMLRDLAPETVIDAGCGEGFYTNQIADVLPDSSLYGFDLSKYGVDEACKAHKNNILYGVANVFHLPFSDACADVLLSIFAPFDMDEINRVVKDRGFFIKVGPAQRHLLDLKQIVYPSVYENEVEHLQDNRFQLVNEKVLSYMIDLKDAQDIWALFQMTPYYWKSPKEGSERLKVLQQLKTQVHFQVEVYQKKDLYDAA